jgi:signal peptidase I
MMNVMDYDRPFQIQKPRPGRLKAAVQFGISIVAAGLLAFFLNLFVFQSYYVDGESMSPTLHSSDRLIISKVEKSTAFVARRDYVPVRGQIVVIDGEVSPATASTAPHLIKRVVGIPGDRLVVRDGEVRLFNPEHPTGINEDTLLGLTLERTFANDPIDITIPDHNVFVMGDNRKEGGSYDSRSFGLVKTDYIVGRLWARVLPLDARRVF